MMSYLRAMWTQSLILFMASMTLVSADCHGLGYGPGDSNAEFDVEFLLWRASDPDVTLATISTSVTQAGAVATVFSTIHPVQEWDPGVRVGMSYRLPCFDLWLRAYWTHFNNRSRATAESNPLVSSSIDIGLDQGEIVNPFVMDGTFRVAFDYFDLDVAHDFYFGRRFVARPFMGLRVSWLKNHTDTSIVGIQDISLDTVRESFKRNVQFLGAGLRVGSDFGYSLGCGFRLYGSAAASLSCGRQNNDFVVDEIIESTPATRVTFGSTDNYNHTQAATDIALGLAWNSFFGDSAGVTLRFGWEQHVFYEVYNISQESSNKDVSLDGFVFSAGFDF